MMKMKPRGVVYNACFAGEQLLGWQSQKEFLHRIMAQDENGFTTITSSAENHGSNLAMLPR